MTPDQFIHYLVNCESDDRHNRSVTRAVKQANFRYKTSVEQIDYSIERRLDRNQMHRFAALDFIKEHEDLFITGSTGTGKSYLATALGYQACQSGYRVMYVNTANLMGQLKLAKAKGNHTGRAETYRAPGSAHTRRLNFVFLLRASACRRFGIQPFDSQSRVALLDIIEDRNQKKSTIIT